MERVESRTPFIPLFYQKVFVTYEPIPVAFKQAFGFAIDKHRCSYESYL